MEKTITFNTGRKYTAEGQIITATLHDDQTVTFWDESRMIDGEFQLEPHRSFTAAEVLRQYDSGNARGTARSARDGMQRGGCNTVRQAQKA